MAVEVKVKVEDRLYSILCKLAEREGVTVENLIHSLVVEALIEKGVILSLDEC